MSRQLADALLNCGLANLLWIDGPSLVDVTAEVHARLDDRVDA